MPYGDTCVAHNFFDINTWPPWHVFSFVPQLVVLPALQADSVHPFLQNIDIVSDVVSAGFSNLSIAFVIDNKGLAPPQAPIAHAQSDAIQRPFPFLFLPLPVQQRVYMHLRSRDCIALSSTCHQMYQLNTLAYTHLEFLPTNSLFSLAQTIYQLGTVLACSPHYAGAVRTIRIVGWTSPDVPAGWDGAVVHDALDKGIVCLLEHAAHVCSLTIDLNLTKTINCLPKTFSALATHARTSIRQLSLTQFAPPTYTAAESSPPLLDDPPAYEQVSLNVCSGAWLPIMMRDPRKLRWFALSMADSKDWQPGDTIWAMTLHRIAESATELETLVLSGGAQNFDADILGQTLRIGFVRGVCLEKIKSPPSIY